MCSEFIKNLFQIIIFNIKREQFPSQDIIAYFLQESRSSQQESGIFVDVVPIFSLMKNSSAVQ
jgi:hypothetical protein